MKKGGPDCSGPPHIHSEIPSDQYFRRSVTP